MLRGPPLLSCTLDLDRDQAPQAELCNMTCLCRVQILVLLSLLQLSCAAHQQDDLVTKVRRYTTLLDSLGMYRPELPRELLSRAVGLQGDRSRLDRVVTKMIQGEPVVMALLGGSLSLRGWNHADESYIAQVHKWLELALVSGCRDEWAGEEEGSKAEADGGEPEEAVEEEKEEEEVSDEETAGQESDKSQRQRRRRRSGAIRHLTKNGPLYDPDPGLDPSMDRQAVSSASYLATGHVCASSHIRLLNLAVPAAGPGYAERCAMQHLPDDVDLVVLDFGCNDYVDSKELAHPERKAYERILRHALSRPHKPAVIAFEAFSWLQSEGSFFGSFAQEKHVLMSEYYGEVQVLSARAALFQLMNASSDPLRLIHLAKNDLLHVSLRGHRWYADILINFLREAAVGVIANGLAAEAIKAAAVAQPGVAGAGQAGGKQHVKEEQPADGSGSLPPVLAQLFTPSRGGDSAGHAESSEDEVAATATAASDDGVFNTTCLVQSHRGTSYATRCSAPQTPGSWPLLPPFFPLNELNPAGVCAVGEELQNVAVGPHPGWQLVDEAATGRAGAAFHKWGFVSDTVDAVLALQVGSHPAAWTGDSILAWLIYLRSYSGMGIASVQCDGGCQCKELEVDGHMKPKASVPMLVSFDIQRVLPAKDPCMLKVTVLAKSSSSGHKFKVLGLTTSETAIWHIDAGVHGGSVVSAKGSG